MLLAVNTLLKDTRDSNPTIRALALKTLCSLDHEAFVEHRLRSINDGLKDSSSYVRRAAVMCTLNLDKEDLSTLKDSGIVNKMYELIRDSDPIVVVNCLMTLEEILKSEGGVVLNRKMVGYVLKRLDSFTTWGLVYVSKLLLKYKPTSEEEVLDIMNVLDPLLAHNSVSVTSNSLQLFLHLVKDMPQLKDQIFQRCQNVFLALFTSGNTELTAVSIKFLEQHLDYLPQLFTGHHRTLFCRLKDPVYLKVQKLHLLCGLINMENFTEILDEIVLHCTNKDTEVSLCAISCMKRLVKEWPDVAEVLLKAFVKLMKSEKDHVVSNTLQMLVTLPIEMMQNIPSLAEQLCDIAGSLTQEDGIMAALYLMGKLNNASDGVLPVVENFMENYQDLSPKVKSQLLVTGVQLLCQRPAEFQPVVGELLDLCIQDSDRDLVEQARFYYMVIEQDPDNGMDIFSSI